MTIGSWFNGLFHRTRAANGQTESTDIRPHQPRCLAEEHTNVEEADDRFWLIEHNADAKLFSYGLASFLLSKEPRPFEYSVPSLDVLDEQWKTTNMFKILEEAIGIAFGVNSAVIVRFTNGSFRVFSAADALETDIDEFRNVLKIKLHFPQYTDSTVQMVNAPSGVIANNDFWVTIGEDAVLITPLPCNYDVYGRSLLQWIWQMILNKIELRFYGMYHIYRGGLGAKFITMPDDATLVEKLEAELKKGPMSEYFIAQYPKGMQDAEKAITVSQASGPTTLPFSEMDKLLSQDQDFPISFMEGSAPTGALGGQAPQVNQDEEDKQVKRYWKYVADAVVLINKVFFNVTEIYDVMMPQNVLQTDNQTNGVVDNVGN